MTRIAVVLWGGVIGGAETFTVDLCGALRVLGADVGVVFVTHGEPLAARLDTAGIPHTALGLARGRHVTRHARALARSVRAFGPERALTPRAGYLTATLRAGGYRGRIVAIAHDAVFDLGPWSARDRFIWRVDRASGFWASDIDVAVSDFALAHMRRQLHARQLIRIYNGVNLDEYTAVPVPHREPVTIGWAGRLVRGKGVDVLLRAFALGPGPEGARLVIAGDGPTLPMLRQLTRVLGLNRAVEFTGPVVDMPAFWRGCDVASVPSATIVESFGMSAVEAMSCGRPVVVTANGALPEVVEDGVTGSVVPRGDVDALAEALSTLTQDAERRHTAGAAARVRCEQRFDLRDCAASYLELFRDG